MATKRQRQHKKLVEFERLNKKIFHGLYKRGLATRLVRKKDLNYKMFV